jgi:hypothetical protein
LIVVLEVRPEVTPDWKPEPQNVTLDLAVGA